MKIIKEIMSWTGNILVALVLAILINAFVFQQTYVEGHSMEPTLHDNDRVVVSKLVNILDSIPEYGDIVIVDSDINAPRTFTDELTENLKNNLITSMLFKKEVEEKYWIKRVIGKPGDILEFTDGQIIRNGEVLVEPYVKEQPNYFKVKKVIIPDNHVFVMGDNRNHSRDSRSIGSVPIDHVIGKYKFRFKLGNSQ